MNTIYGIHTYFFEVVERFDNKMYLIARGRILAPSIFQVEISEEKMEIRQLEKN